MCGTMNCIASTVDSTLIGVMKMGRLIDADKLKADLEKAISKNEDMDCLDFLRVASVMLYEKHRPPMTRTRLWSSWKRNLKSTMGKIGTKPHT